MQKKSYAILDVGSSKVTAVIGERGVNKTFFIKAHKDYVYDGFSENTFFDVEGFKNILRLAVQFIDSSAKNIDCIYVGVPGAFTEVIVKDSQISFPKKKKITANDVDALFDSAFVLPSTKYTLINRSAIVYELGDYRRLVSPVGQMSELLKGKLSFILLSNYFLDIVKPTIVCSGFKKVEFISTPIAEAMYLVQAEVRDRIAIILDVGHISTTFTLIQGDGILYQKSFDYGGGYITAELLNKFDINFNDAEELKKRINLTKMSLGPYGFINLENGSYFNAEESIECVKRSLDDLCENLSDIIDDSGYVIPEYVPIMITGGGIAFIRGAKEHISSRLGMLVEVLSPQVPLMDKPTCSSILSLLDLTFEQNNI